jgi:hypothetical protein
MTSNTPHAAPARIELPVEFVEELWPGTVISPPRTRRAAPVARTQSRTHASAMAFEVLHGALVFLSGLSRRKRSKVLPAA